MLHSINSFNATSIDDAGAVTIDDTNFLKRNNDFDPFKDIALSKDVHNYKKIEKYSSVQSNKLISNDNPFTDSP